MREILPIIVLLPFLFSPIVAYCGVWHRYAPAWLSGILTIVLIYLLSPYATTVLADSSAISAISGNTIINRWNWISQIGLYFSFRADGLSLFFAYLIIFIGLLIIIYAAFYLHKKDSTARFYSNLLLFMGSMVGIVLSENIILMVIFWELTSITSFLLISFWQNTSAGRRGARIALGVTAMGGLSLFVAMLIIGKIAGSFELSVVFSQAETIRQHSLFFPTLILLLIGAFSKSAQFPFQFWLPQAMAAPTPVSAYLHSATMVKAGLFLMARFTPVFASTPEWFWIVSLVGLTTLFIGAYYAMFAADLKGLLAYSTISNLGLITLLLGFGSKMAMVVAIFHIINHAFYKAPLFMVAGIIDHECGTRRINKLSALAKYMPLTAILGIIASASMAGIPLTNGFLSKELLLEQSVNLASAPYGNLAMAWLPIIVLISALFTVAYSLRFGYGLFFGKDKERYSHKPHDPNIMMNVPVIIFISLCVIIGFFPAFSVEYIINKIATGALQDAPPHFHLAIWHGINIPLIMSIIALVGGIILYKILPRLQLNHRKNLGKIQGYKIYISLVVDLIIFATRLTKFFQRDSLRLTSSYIIAFALFISTWFFWKYSDLGSGFFGNRSFIPADAISIMFLILLVISCFLVCYWHNKRMQALIALAVVGLCVALSFLRLSAPDLALTQLSVEAVTTILLMLALFLFPLPAIRKSDVEDLRFKWWSIGLAALSGIGVSLLTLAVLSRDFASIAPYYLYKSLSEGGGSNVVNVILVDFRGIDTLGEITVLAIASLGIFALLKGIKLKPTRRISEMKIMFSRDYHPIILRTMSRVLFPLILMLAVFIFIRGHNQPGGGFIAGLVAAIALVIQYLANGLEWTGERMKINMYATLGVGLLIAASTGIGSLLFSYPFLTSSYGHFHLPLFGEFELATAAIFDLGVFMVVVSSTVISLVKLGTARHKIML